MSIILESDIIYNILPHVDLETIGKLFCVNKKVNKLCFDKHFWKLKIENDHKNIVFNSNEWLHEYKNIHVAHVQAIKFIEYLIDWGKKYHGTNSFFSIFYIKKRIDSSYLCWNQPMPLLMPTKKIKQFISLTDDISTPFRITFWFWTIKKIRDTSYIDLSIDELTNYITNLRYDYGKISIYDYLDVPIFTL